MLQHMKAPFLRLASPLLCVFFVFLSLLLHAQQWTVHSQTGTGGPIRFALSQSTSSHNEIITVDKDNTVWMITGSDRRLARYTPSSGQWQVFAESASTLFTDRKGNVYASSSSQNNTYKYDGTNWVQAFAREGLDFITDRRDNFWFCTRDGDILYKYDGSTITPVPVPPAIRLSLQLEIDTDDFIWYAGSFDGQLSSLVQLNGTKSYDDADADIFNYLIYSMEALQNNEIWVGTYYSSVAPAKGLARLNSQTDTWTMYNRSNSPLPNDTIMYLQGDIQNRIWVATNNGLARFDGTNWTVYTTANSPLPNQAILSIAVDALGNKWIASPDALVRFNEITPDYQFQNCGLYVTFTDQSQSIDGNITAWQWDFAGLKASSEQNPQFTFPQAGTYTVTLTVTDAMGTRNAVKKQITVGDPVNPLNLGPDVDTCTPSVALVSNVAGANNYTWTLPTGVTTAGSSTHAATENGRYALKITTQDGCSYSDTIQVVLNRFTTTEFTVTAGNLPLPPDITVYPSTTITFAAAADIVSWDFGNGATAAGNPVTFSYSQPGTYSVRLDAGMDERQCPVRSTKVLEVTDIFIANAITPNGDGKNDELFIDHLLDEASITVLNRWGQLVYERDPYMEGFAGTGLESGVYYYEIRFRNFNNVFKGYVHIIK
jgi:gliding motility-associated-like protein